MSDYKTIIDLENLVGKPFVYRFDEEGVCIELSLHSNDEPFFGLIRRFSHEDKQKVLSTICMLEGLVSLDLARNKLRVLPKGIGRLKKLKSLNLLSNYLEVVPDQLLSLVNLRSLNLANNDLEALPESFSRLSELRHLWLHKNVRLRSIDELRGLYQLELLNLYFVSLRTLPEFIYSFSNLKSLAVWNVNNFPSGLSGLSSLEFFTNCGGVKTLALPDDFTQLKNLRMARLYHNNLSCLPRDIGRLKGLEQLSIYSNAVSDLPESLSECVALEKLNLGGNRFTELPDFLFEMPKISWLGVFDNPLSYDSLPDSTLAGVGSVIKVMPFHSVY